MKRFGKWSGRVYRNEDLPNMECGVLCSDDVTVDGIRAYFAKGKTYDCWSCRACPMSRNIPNGSLIGEGLD